MRTALCVAALLGFCAPPASSQTVGLAGVMGTQTVSGGSMPFVLLGNSFLMRFKMTRTNDQLVLEKGY